MNEDAFARRFYADRAELESLRIALTVERPLGRGGRAGELLAAARRTSICPRSSSPSRSSRPCRPRSQLLDGEFAYAEPLRLALQQITWGRPSPLRAPEQRSVALGITASAGGHELSARLAKIETAIFRNKTITFDYYTMEPRRARSRGGWTPTTCCSRGASSTCSAMRMSARPSGSSGSPGSRGGSPTRPRPSTTSSARRTSIHGLCEPGRVAVGRAARRCRDPARGADRLAGRTSFRALRGDPRVLDGLGDGREAIGSS